MPALSRIVSTRRFATSLGIRTSHFLRSNLTTPPSCVSSHFNNAIRCPLFCFNSARFFGTKKIYNCPEAGEGQTEIDILEWFVKPGDKVKTFDVIGRGKYEKADIDIIAPFAGTVSTIFVDAGSVATIHKPLVEFEVEGVAADTAGASETQSDTSQSSPSGSVQSKQSTQSTQTNETSNRVNEGPILTTPAVRKIAKDNNLDLAIVPGTGKDGRILKEDVLNFLEGNVAPIDRTASTQKSQQTQTQVTRKPVAMSPPAPKAADDFVEKIIGVKRAMVKKMTEANEVPMFGYGDEINMSQLVTLRKELKPMAEKEGIKLSYMPFIIKAVSLALQNYPMLNAHISPNCEELIHRANHNIGVAVDSPEGLIVPNIKQCQNKSIAQIASDLDGLIQRARNSQITNDDITGGTFTLSNIGAIGGTYCRPICFVPEVCIGALGAFQMLPRYDAKYELRPTPMMAVSWSADHRVIDGATVARFSNEWKQYLENPGSMLLHLQ